MASAQTTKIILGLSDARSAKLASDTIGEVKRQYIKESRNDRGFFQASHRTESLEIKVEPLLLASAFSGLSRLHGYLKYENLVVPIRTRWQFRPARSKGFVPHELEAIRTLPNLVYPPRKKPKKEAGPVVATLPGVAQAPKPSHEQIHE
jgi:hypothetical protein